MKDNTTGQQQQQIADSELNVALQRAKTLAASNGGGGGQKRASNPSDDLNFYPVKRDKATTDGNMAMAGMGMGAPVAETMVDAVDIPEHQVGLVIGRGGEQIQLIQQQSGCRVQLAGESNMTGFRQCTLQGPKPYIDKARQMIMDVLERARNQQQHQPGGGGGIQNGGDSVVEMSIPGPKCGLIIGKNGDTIKGLQEQLGVKMMLIQDSHQVTMGAKPLRISGTPENIEQAKRVIESLLQGDGTQQQPNFQQALRIGGGVKSIGEVIVPRTSVGIIIGKGGDTIKRLAAESGAKIQFKPDDPNLQERCAVIQGTPEQITRATQMISELVTRSGTGGGPQQQETFYMHVPANKTGLVIGKGGDTIKQICGETGAHVELSRDAPPNPNEKVFVIRGTPYQIHHVQHIIRIKVGDIAPGTPLPPFHGTVGALASTPAAAAAPLTAVGNPYGPTTHQQPYGSAPAAHQVQDPSVWNQYYNQQQAGFAAATGGAPQAQFGAAAQHYQTVPGAMNTAVSQAPQQQMMNQMQQQQAAMQAHHQQPQQQQQALGMGGGVSSNAPAGMNSAINPQTGQPDYSAQWAEYYRTMGMHEQASLIEQQMKQTQQMTSAGGQQRPPQQQLFNMQ